ncbi:MAG TPA: flagellar biosynthesis protein FlhB [Nitrospirota bacterium]|nr:flagellar biosynthesis protein FlhB [Nitrospirota bacterium]
MAENNDRTEQATPRRRQKAQEKGQVARSRELGAMAATAGVLFVFYFSGTSFMNNLTALTGRLLGLRYGRDSLTVMRAASVDMVMILVPVFSAAVVFAIFSNVMQGGIVFKPLSMELTKLNPLEGLKNLFSISALPGVFKSIFKFILGIVLFYIMAKRALGILPMTSAMELHDIQSVAFGLIGKTVVYAFTTYFILALIDYLYERWKFERSLRMSKEEIREESRESEGDPLIKAKVKSMQRDMARRRMMEAVPKATVVITNPTHIAVALLYKKDHGSAPKVIAKGKGYIAERIREIARKHRVPIMEDKPLARALFKVKLDSFIPEELYRAVARILAYIYKLKGVA